MFSFNIFVFALKNLLKSSLHNQAIYGERCMTQAVHRIQRTCTLSIGQCTKVSVSF